MAVSVSNLVVDQNSDFSASIVLEDTYGNPLDLTNYTATGKIRKYYGSNKFYDLTITIQAPLTSGLIKISIPKLVTKTMDIGRYVYDVKITDQFNYSTKVLEGIVTVNGGVS